MPDVWPAGWNVSKFAGAPVARRHHLLRRRNSGPVAVSWRGAPRGTPYSGVAVLDPVQPLGVVVEKRLLLFRGHIAGDAAKRVVSVAETDFKASDRPVGRQNRPI